MLVRKVVQIFMMFRAGTLYQKYSRLFDLFLIKGTGSKRHVYLYSLVLVEFVLCYSLFNNNTT